MIATARHTGPATAILLALVLLPACASSDPDGSADASRSVQTDSPATGDTSGSVAASSTLAPSDPTTTAPPTTATPVTATPAGPVGLVGGRVGLGRMLDLAIAPDESLLVGAGYHHLWLIELPSMETTVIDLGDDVAPSVAFDPTGTHFAVGLGSGSIQLWDTVSRSLVRTLPDVHDEWANNLAFSADGTRLGSVEQRPQFITSETVVVMDVATGESVAEIDDVVASELLLDQNGGVLIGHGSKSLVAWDLASGDEVYRFDFPDDRDRPSSTDIDLDDDGSTLFVLRGRGQPLQSYDTTTWTGPVDLTEPDDAFVDSMEFDNDQLLIFEDTSATTRSTNGTLIGEPFEIVEPPIESGDSDAVALAGDTVAVLLRDGHDLVVYDLAEHQMISSTAVSSQRVESVSFDSTGEQLFLHHSDDALTWWVLSANKAQLTARVNDVSRAQFTDDGSIVAATRFSSDGPRELLDLGTGDVAIADYENRASSTFVYDADLGLYASRTENETVLYDAADGQIVQEIVAAGAPDLLALHPDGSHLAQITGTTLQMWEIETGAIVVEQSFPRLEPIVEFAAGQVWVMTGDDEGAQQLASFDLPDGAATTSIDLGNTDDVFVLSSDGRRAAVLMGNSLAHVFDTDTGEVIQEVRATSATADIAITPDGSMLAMAGTSGTALLVPLPAG